MTNKAKTYVPSGVVWYISIPVIFIGIGVMLGQGYRLQPNFTIAKNGHIEVTLPFSQTSVFIDGEKKYISAGEKETVAFPASVKTHEVVLSRDGYFPWYKKVAVKGNTKSTLTPFFVTAQTTGQIVTQYDPQYWTMRYDITQVKLPSEDAPLTQDGVSIWVNGNSLLMKKDNQTTTIHSFKTPILSLAFYKDRTDVALVASEAGIFALELIPHANENKANIFPVFKGNEPVFMKTNPNFITVLDKETLMQVVIQ